MVLITKVSAKYLPPAASLRRLALFALAGMLLAGCAVTPSLETWQPPDATNVADWHLKGRVSLSRDDQGWHARLAWQEQDERFELKVAGPLGQGRFRLTGDAQSVLMERGNGQKIKARNADNLVRKTTGWNLPVNGLRYWVRGLPVPGLPAMVQRDLQGRLAELEQSGWKITYKRYQLVDGIGWPARMRLERDNLTVRLVIDNWQTGEVSGPDS